MSGIGEFDEGSTLVNLLPLIANRVLGSPYAARPDTVRAEDGDWATPDVLPGSD